MSEAFSQFEAMSTALEQADVMAEWLPDYFYEILDTPYDVADIAAERLSRHFDAFYTVGLDMLRDEMLSFPRSMHRDVFLYICGYPEESVKHELKTSYAKVIALLDQHFPPLEEVEGAEVNEQPAEGFVSAVRHFLPLIIDQEGSWRQRAACHKSESPDIFCVKLNDPAEEALKVCERCTVRDECLDYALENNEPYDVWGGKTADERRAMRNERRQQEQLKKYPPPSEAEVLVLEKAWQFYRYC